MQDIGCHLQVNGVKGGKRFHDSLSETTAFAYFDSDADLATIVVRRTRFESAILPRNLLSSDWFREYVAEVVFSNTFRSTRPTNRPRKRAAAGYHVTGTKASDSKVKQFL